MNYFSKFLLNLQYILGRLFIIVVGPLIVLFVKLMRYRVKNLADIRQQAKSLFEDHRGPWIICANHLTMIDSVILAYALVPLHRYILRFNLLPWNLPEQANFQRNIFLAVICYLTKCIPIHRGGDRKIMKATLAKCKFILNKKEKLLIFPEGGRSRTNRVDVENFSYGVGRFIVGVPDRRVMCIYLRGDGQSTYGFIPRFNEQFTMAIETFEPVVKEERGLKAQRECARQIVEHLAEMEKQYFDKGRQRYYRSDRAPHSGEKSGYAVC